MYQLLRKLLIIAIIFALIGLSATWGAYYFLAPKLPDTATLKETQLQIPLRVFSAEGQLIAEFGDKRRIPVEYQEIPKPFIEAFLAAEDDRFFEHPGVDYQGILRAAITLLMTGSKAKVVVLSRCKWLETSFYLMKKLIYAN
jgi:penicillin-binding protein 1A